MRSPENWLDVSERPFHADTLRAIAQAVLGLGITSGLHFTSKLLPASYP